MKQPSSPMLSEQPTPLASDVEPNYGYTKTPAQAPTPILARTSSSSALKNVVVSSTNSASSQADPRKADYNNCIIQLQSAAAQVLNSTSHLHQNSTTPNVSSSQTNNANMTSSGATMIMPIMTRTSRLNQSQQSIKSNIMCSTRHIKDDSSVIIESVENNQPIGFSQVAPVVEARKCKIFVVIQFYKN